VEHGFLCWCWFEESFQIQSEDDFNKIDMSLRGEMPPGYFKQLTMTMNPWSEKHWIKRRFFDTADPDVLAMSTTYKCNEFLGSDDIAIFEKMRKENPRRYSIEGEGNWGIAQGLVYTDWVEADFDATEVAKRPGVSSAYGLDFGFSADPTAFIALLVDEVAKEIYVHDECYEKGMLNSDIANVLKYKGYSKSVIFADSAEPKSIEEIKKLGIARIRPCKKGPDSIRHGIQKLQEYKLIVHPRCTNTLVELSNYVWDSKNDSPLNRPVDEFNHLLDALRYSMSGSRGNGLSVLK
jgi:phage terminase large subunit